MCPSSSMRQGYPEQPQRGNAVLCQPMSSFTQGWAVRSSAHGDKWPSCLSVKSDQAPQDQGKMRKIPLYQYWGHSKSHQSQKSVKGGGKAEQIQICTLSWHPGKTHCSEAPRGQKRAGPTEGHQQELLPNPGPFLGCRPRSNLNKRNTLQELEKRNVLDNRSHI